MQERLDTTLPIQCINDEKMTNEVCAATTCRHITDTKRRKNRKLGYVYTCIVCMQSILLLPTGSYTITAPVVYHIQSIEVQLISKTQKDKIGLNTRMS